MLVNELMGVCRAGIPYEVNQINGIDEPDTNLSKGLMDCEPAGEYYFKTVDNIWIDGDKLIIEVK